MTRELLELAARAIGLEVRFIETWSEGLRHSLGELAYTRKPYDTTGKRITDWPNQWNPATSQADSDRMACQLEIGVEFHPYEDVTATCWPQPGMFIDYSVAHDNTLEGKCAAVRQARLLVAAEIGRAK